MPKKILPLLLLLPALASADEGGLTLCVVPTGTPGILAFFLRHDLPPDPLFRPPCYIAAGGLEESETVLRQIFRAEIRRNLPNRLPLPHAPDVAIGEVEPGAVVERVRALGGPAVLIVTDPGLDNRRETLALELPGVRVMPGVRAGWVGYDARYDPGSLEVYAWEWCDPCRSSGPFGDSFSACGLCSGELGPVPPRLVWRDRLGRPRSLEATVEWLTGEELAPQRELWYMLRGRDAEGR
ncbi:MAG: hypothetical protein A2Y64_08965 [Candidatus Coatesbacteria bacterium RBG_13_66_14]|uniref:Gingipain domain-containing protein n=1 Tax=Candidatus Coatesbacteria bacterium RBG_13_66_14 TaxID=1817816 RepID=A0A1F5FIF0_9BACT|nr:MAG: hypothetical protein A2Y64_08965 [Candidatus Coatesbacteria bacterium RBG_13_66_14]